MSISVGADWDMPRRDRAQVNLWRLPLLRHANRGLALDRFADLTRRGDVAIKGSLKRPQCDGIAIGCTRPELQFFPDILGQLLLGNVGVAIRDRLHRRILVLSPSLLAPNDPNLVCHFHRLSVSGEGMTAFRLSSPSRTCAACP